VKSTTRHADQQRQSDASRHDGSTAHVDALARARLRSRAQWSDSRCELSEGQYVETVNCACVRVGEGRPLGPGATGRAVKSSIALSPGHEPDAMLTAGLPAHLRVAIVPCKYSRIIEFGDNLPRTPTDRLPRQVLRESETASAAQCAAGNP